MKLLMITGLGSVKDLVSDKRGAFYNTLEEFHKHWDRIDIISPKIRGQNPGIKNLFGNVYIHISSWPLIFHPIWFLKKGLEIYKEQKFDLMTVQEFPPFYNGIGARLLWSRLFKEKSRIPDSRSESGQKTGVPYILEIFHVPGYPAYSNLKEFIYRSLVRAFISYDASCAKAVRIMNNDVGKFLEASGVPRNKLALIPAIYIDMEVFKPMDVPKEYDLIFIGRLESNKGIDLFIETVKILKRQIPNIKCLIVGEGSQKNHWKLEIGNWKLQDSVLLYGFAKDQQEIAELLNKSKILVMPSYNEGGPRVVVEAMACGVPVLATPVGIVPNLLKNAPDTHKNTKSGVEDPRFASRALHEANRDLGGEIISWDPEDIASKATALLNDSERYNRLSRAAVERAKSFEKKAAIKNYAEQIKLLTQ